MSTDRSCTIYVTNNWGETITGVVLTHSTSAHDPDVISVDTMADNAKSYKIPISFQTGASPAYDYWNVSFTDSSGDVWTTPNNDRCNLSSDDEGTTLSCSIDNTTDYKEKLHITCNDGCAFEITKNS
ncbi:MAG: hypothetical protein ACQ9MH_08375 [Nitrospinales bacterium]